MSDDRPYAEHSPGCWDYNTLLTDEDERIVTCQCKPNENATAPDAYELWWCEWCGEESGEMSNPCQRCGSPITRRTYVAAEHLQTLAAVLAGELPSPEKLAAAQRALGDAA